ncbi:MAG: arsenosugar biosynthesis radical SAM (seleno)protein ArsS [Phycisphaerae bacterium]
MAKSLVKQGHPLAVLDEQRRVIAADVGVEPFETRMAGLGLRPLRATGITVVQLNVGRMCNQVCKHCHVDAGPDRTEIMTRDTMRHCMEAVRRTAAPIVDLTGGAPEMNPDFRWLVEQVKALGRHVIDRCNLTILMASGYEDMPEFLARHRVEIIASLPYYLEKQTDAQRGDHVFERSIAALRRLNGLGYGVDGSELLLNLVYNPVGAFLPPKQQAIEADYKRELRRRYGIVFNRLFAVTNLPINRFLDYLLAGGNYEGYMRRLSDAFNPDAAAAVMCRTMLSVGWDGRLYDCDFNQMLDVTVNHGMPKHIRDFDPDLLSQREVCIGNHCYGCTAGAGSSCTGTLAG